MYIASSINRCDKVYLHADNMQQQEKAGKETNRIVCMVNG